MNSYMGIVCKGHCLRTRRSALPTPSPLNVIEITVLKSAVCGQREVGNIREFPFDLPYAFAQPTAQGLFGFAGRSVAVEGVDGDAFRRKLHEPARDLLAPQIRNDKLDKPAVNAWMRTGAVGVIRATGRLLKHIGRPPGRALGTAVSAALHKLQFRLQKLEHILAACIRLTPLSEFHRHNGSRRALQTRIPPAGSHQQCILAMATVTLQSDRNHRTYLM